MKKLLISSLSLVIAAASFGQNLLTERNFQRLDHVSHSQASKNFLKTASRTHYWQLIGTTTQPDWNRSYSGALSYTDVPHADGDDAGFHEFQAAVSFTRLDPKGGQSDNQLGATLSYQLTGDPALDQLSAFTVGLQYGYIDEFNNVAIPSFSGSYRFAGDMEFIPTISSYLIRAANTNTDGAVPDFMVMYQPKGKLAFSLDYTMATAISGPATAQLAGKYSLTSSGLTAIKAEATWSAANRPAFTGVLAYKF
jgi:hypothetical protein